MKMLADNEMLDSGYRNLTRIPSTISVRLDFHRVKAKILNYELNHVFETKVYVVVEYSYYFE